MKEHWFERYAFMLSMFAAMVSVSTSVAIVVYFAKKQAFNDDRILSQEQRIIELEKGSVEMHAQYLITQERYNNVKSYLAREKGQ